MKLICEGERDYKEVMAEAIDECYKIFTKVLEEQDRLKEMLY